MRRETMSTMGALNGPETKMGVGTLHGEAALLALGAAALDITVATTAVNFIKDRVFGHNRNKHE